jgi:hypothetical protein
MLDLGTYGLDRRKRDAQVTQLKQERLSWEPHWKDVAEFILPYRHRLNLTDQNRGDRRNQSIYDPTGTIAYRTFKAGIVGNVCSPARPWFGLTTSDPDRAEFGPNKEWLDFVRNEMATLFSRSNLYLNMPNLVGDIGGFATGDMTVEEDLEYGIHTAVRPLGTWWISTDHKSRVKTKYTEFRLTIDQIVPWFGRTGRGKDIDWSRFSTFVKDQWDQGNYETWVDVAHLVTPNHDYSPRSFLSKDKPFKSCYWEIGNSAKGTEYGQEDKDRLLKESGFDEFPDLVGRFEVIEGDAYGIDCCGMVAVGDIKELQHGEVRTGEAIDAYVKPPLMGPPELQQVSLIPGKITYFTEREGTKGLRPIYEVKPDISHLGARQGDIRNRIYDAFYVPLFRMLSMLDDRQRTATEIVERKEEKIIELSPMLERLNFDIFDPLIDRTFSIMLRQGRIPRPPEELWGQNLKVEYTSVMAQAMKAVGIASIDRVINTAMAIAKVHHEVVDKIDWDQVIDEYADRAGAPPRIIRSDEKTEEHRQRIRAAQQAAAQAETSKLMSETAKNMGSTPTGEKNLLTDLAGAVARGSEAA